MAESDARNAQTGSGHRSRAGVAAGGRHRRHVGGHRAPGDPGSARSRSFDAARHSTRFAGEVPGFDPLGWIDKKDVKKCARFIQFAIAATRDGDGAERAADRAANATRVGVVIGSGIGGFEVIEREHRTLLERGPERVSPFFILSSIINLAAGYVSVRLGAKGPNSAVATACTTGAHADRRRLPADPGRLCRRDDLRRRRGEHHAARRRRLRGDARAVAAQRRSRRARAGRGTPIATASSSVKAPASWCSKRSGQADRRGAPILAEIVGYGMSADAHHLTAPPEDGDGVARVMRGGAGRRGSRRRRRFNTSTRTRPRRRSATWRKRAPSSSIFGGRHVAPRGQLDQVDDRPPSRRRRRARGRPDRSGDCANRWRRRPSISTSPDAGESPRPRAPPGPARRDRARDDELVRVRRDECVADLQTGVGAVTSRADRLRK